MHLVAVLHITWSSSAGGVIKDFSFYSFKPTWTRRSPQSAQKNRNFNTCNPMTPAQTADEDHVTLNGPLLHIENIENVLPIFFFLVHEAV